jgi:hypothetical protein
VEASQRTPIVSHIIGVLWRLHDLATAAKGDRANCMQLDAFGRGALCAFDFHGGHKPSHSCASELTHSAEDRQTDRICMDKKYDNHFSLGSRKKMVPVFLESMISSSQTADCVWLNVMLSFCPSSSAFLVNLSSIMNFHRASLWWHAGKKLAFIDGSALDLLYSLLKTACDLMECRSQPGEPTGCNQRTKVMRFRWVPRSAGGLGLVIGRTEGKIHANARLNLLNLHWEFLYVVWALQYWV